MIKWIVFLRQRWWVLWGLSIAFIIQVMYDFLGEPIFTNIMPKQWWGLGIGLGLGVWLWLEMRRIQREASKLNGVRMHFLCLLTNERLILSPKEMDDIRSHIRSVLSDNNPTWGYNGTKAWVVWERGAKERIINNLRELQEKYKKESSLLEKKLGEVLDVCDKLQAYLGYYHSRIIVSVYVPSIAVEGLRDIRNIRKILGDSIKTILEDFLKEVKEHPPAHPVNCIRCYPLVEIGEELFNRLKSEELKDEQREYGFESTCFYYDIPDVARARIKIPKVRMRVSGAKTIFSKMSDQLFWDLVNLIYYHGLYPYKPLGTTVKDEKITFYLHDQLLARLAEVIHREFFRLGNTLSMRRYTIIALGLSVLSIIIAIIVALIRLAIK